ncbi:MAG: peptide chain release factor 2 [Oscillospiraceae bacterium]|jgi:peptide chain release factor 2|nr:peptide chain release factor 2 [Oscillospiraceae bacterium]
MLEYDEIRAELLALNPEISELSEALGLKRLEKEISELDEQTMRPDFWNDAENAKKTGKKLGAMKNTRDAFLRLKGDYEDVLTMVELAEEEDDPSLLTEIKEAAEKVKAALLSQKLSTLLSGEYDGKNAILTLHAGAGGTEAMDWVEMLYRMFTRWAERHDFKYELLDYLDGEEAGIKSASVLIQGLNAYGLLKSEHGVHRLVRVSPFDSSGRRHTSFASLEVMPEIDEDVHVEIRDEDIEFEVYRASGAGGQKVNKTSSAVRITHKPTGIVCACQTQRSQLQNREYAMRMLKSKLIEIKEREHLEKISDIKGEQLQIAWGAQIRSYVFMPYTMAKDHRTGFEAGNINAVMDGEIDGFINAYLKAKSLEKSFGETF